jgi:hypothetical protein
VVIDDIPHFYLYTESRVIHSLSRITRNALAVMTTILFVALLRYILNQIVKSECQRPHGVSGHEEVIYESCPVVESDKPSSRSRRPSPPRRSSPAPCLTGLHEQARATCISGKASPLRHRSFVYVLILALYMQRRFAPTPYSSATTTARLPWRRSDTRIEKQERQAVVAGDRGSHVQVNHFP